MLHFSRCQSWKDFEQLKRQFIAVLRRVRLSADDVAMTSYHDDQTPKYHHHHHHHHHLRHQYQEQTLFDELHRDVASPLPDLCPRDVHTGSAVDDYFRLSDDDGGGRVCAGCMVPIRDRHYLSAVGNNWHVSCLVCCECRQPLDRQSTCYVHDARIYCRDDYFASVNCSFFLTVIATAGTADRGVARAGNVPSPTPHLPR